MSAVLDDPKAAAKHVHEINKLSKRLHPDAAQAALVLGQLKFTVRRNYSSPPIHGGQIVARVLTDPALRALWEGELAAMRERILAMRRKLHGVISAKVPGRNFDYFLTQRGMFSYTGLGAAQVVTKPLGFRAVQGICRLYDGDY